MEEDGKKYPLLPSNYVTLAQLQERWLEDQRRKQIEKEEEEKRKQRELKEEEERKRCEREFEELKREERENGKRLNKSREGSKTKNNLYRQRPFEKNSPIQTEKSFRAIGVSERRSEESQVGAIVAGNGEGKIDGLKKKKKKMSWKKKKGKPTADDDLTGRTERSLPEYAANVAGNGERKIDGLKKKKKGNWKKKKKGKPTAEDDLTEYTERSLPEYAAVVSGIGERKIDGLKKKKGKPTAEDDLTSRTERSLPEYAEAEKKIPVVLTERDSEKEGVTSDFPRNGKNSVVEGMIAEKKKVPEDRSTEIGRKFEDLSLSGGKRWNERYARNMRGGQWRNSRSSELYNRRSLWKPRDSNFVWVRKGETSDVNAAEVCNSGKQCYHFCIQNL